MVGSATMSRPFVWLGFVLLASGTAVAQEGSSDLQDAEARSLFEAGRTAYTDGEVITTLAGVPPPRCL